MQPDQAATHPPNGRAWLTTRLTLTKALSGLSLPTVHNRPALTLSASAMALGMGSIASLLSLAAAVGPAVASFVAVTVAPLTAGAQLSAAGVLTGVIIYVAGAALVALVTACAIACVAMQARTIYHAALVAKHSITGERASLEAVSCRLRQALSNTGLLGQWTSAALVPLTPFSALRSAMAFGLLQSAQGLVRLHLQRSEGPSEA